jgi:hypothetical protein
MEKNNSDKEILKTLAQKNHYLLIVMLLIIISGFLLFNQISYMGSIYQENKNIDIDNVNKDF